MQMPLSITWSEILSRLILTMVAGALMGFNRGAKGHAAGLRTTILVSLAAAIAMIQANILLPLDGKQSGSFAVIDLMRLPLGILTGVGFLGGGAILKKDGSITGLTTAATLWIATVIGLCFGGGQLGLGGVSTAFGMLTLWAMEWIDVHIPRDHSAVLVVTTAPHMPPPNLDRVLEPQGYRARLRRRTRSLSLHNEEELETHFDLTWKQPDDAQTSLEFLSAVERVCQVKSFEVSSGQH